MKAILSLIISGALVVSGFGQTRNVLVGTNNAVVQPTNFWSADASNARTGLGLGTAATNDAAAFQPSSIVLSNLATSNGAALTNLSVSNIVGTLSLGQGGTSATNASGARAALGLGTASTNPASAFQPSSTILSNLALSNGSGITNIEITNTVGTLSLGRGGTGATNAGGARTNLGLVLTALTNTNADTFRAGIGLGGADQVEFLDVTAEELKVGTNVVVRLINQELTDNGVAVLGWSTNGIDFFGSGVKAATRTNLGLGASWLTNSNSPVFVNTNGEVVSPTNFWQAAPITTTFIESQPNTNFTTNITAARFLHIHSLATNIVNVTNTIVLPTNSLTFEGDIAMVVHKGPTNSLTRVRQAGSTNNLITLSNFNEAVEFTYYNDAWQFLETVAFTAPIYFSGTNAATNAAASRTNLGLGASDAVTFDVVNTTSGLRIFSGTNLVTYIGEDISEFETPLYVGNASGISFSTNNNGAATTRTNLGLGATNIVTFAGITNNGDIRINQTATNNGLLYIYRTNAEPFLGLANLIASNNTTVSNETLFRVGVSEATNKAAQFGFRSTNTNGNGVAVFSVFGYNALMMIGPSDPNAGTNPIQATVYSVSPTNKVMTLITTNTGATLFHRAIEFENTTNQAVTRTNLGLPLAALTNTTVTNFQKAIFYTNTAPSNIGGNLGTIAAWIEIVASDGVTYKIPAYTNVP